MHCDLGAIAPSTLHIVSPNTTDLINSIIMLKAREALRAVLGYWDEDSSFSERYSSRCYEVLDSSSGALPSEAVTTDLHGYRVDMFLL